MYILLKKTKLPLLLRQVKLAQAHIYFIYLSAKNKFYQLQIQDDKHLYMEIINE